jgi:hypothetical protein
MKEILEPHGKLNNEIAGGDCSRQTADTAIQNLYL